MQEKASTASVAAGKRVSMRVKNGVCWIAACLAFILIIGSIMSITDYCDSDLLPTESISEPEEKGMHLAGTPHTPIAIDGDANFSVTASVEGWLGDGSSGNPYVIDGVEIDSNGTGDHCISINNTRVNFTIQNCYLTGANMSYGSGIFMENVTNCKMIGNTIYNNVFNIHLTNAHSVLIMNNIAFDSDWSINLYSSSSNNTIAENNCSFNIWAGIILGHSSNNNTVINNVCDDNVYGVEVYQSAYNTVIGNDCKNNLFYGVLITNSSYNVVEDNSISYSERGIYLSNESMNNTVANNTCSSNSNSGILVFLSDSNTVANNTCSSNNHGIDIDYSSSNTVTNNTSASNTNVGINLFYSDTTDIQWNAFANNPTNSLDEFGFSNVFDYNYWSDYTGTDSNGDGFGDTPYTFTGNSDPHPLMYIPFAPDWLHHPVDQVIEFGNVFEYPLELIITAQTAPYEMSLDDLLNFAVVIDDTIVSNSVLPVGVYPLHIVLTNIYGYKTEGAFTLTVEDTTLPFITSPEDITYTKGEGDHEIAWIMSDLSPISYRVLLNETELTSSPFTTTSTSFSMTLEDKDPGVYNYSMVVEDIWGNMAIDTVIVTVLPIPLLEVLLPWLSVGAVAVIALVMIVFLIQKRKSS